MEVILLEISAAEKLIVREVNVVILCVSLVRSLVGPNRISHLIERKSV